MYMFEKHTKALEDYLTERSNRWFKNYFDHKRTNYVKDLIALLKGHYDLVIKKRLVSKKLETVIRNEKKFAGKKLRPLLQNIYADIKNVRLSDSFLNHVKARLAQSENFSLLHSEIEKNLIKHSESLHSKQRSEYCAKISELLRSSKITINFRANNILDYYANKKDFSQDNLDIKNKFQRSLEGYKKNTKFFKMQKFALQGGRNEAEVKLFEFGNMRGPFFINSAKKAKKDFSTTYWRINKYFNIEKDTFEPGIRPIYGALDFVGSKYFGAAPAYGKSFVVLKSYVNCKATYTAGDSYYHKHAKILPLASNTYFDAVINHASDKLYDLMCDVVDNKIEGKQTEYLANSSEANFIGYVEAQVHNSIDILRDVESFNVSLHEIEGEQEFIQWQKFFASIAKFNVQGYFVDHAAKTILSHQELENKTWQEIKSRGEVDADTNHIINQLSC